LNLKTFYRLLSYGEHLPILSAGNGPLVVVDPGVGTRRKAVVVKKEGHLFVGPDNGVLAGIMGGKESVLGYEIKERKYFLSQVERLVSWPGHLRPVAGQLSGAWTLELGPRVRGLTTLESPARRVKEDWRLHPLGRFFRKPDYQSGRREYGRNWTLVLSNQGKGLEDRPGPSTYGEGRPEVPSPYSERGIFGNFRKPGNALNTLGLKPGTRFSSYGVRILKTISSLGSLSWCF